MNLTDEKQKLIKLLLRSGALRFGDYVTKAGRRSPFFFDLGQINTVTAIYELSIVYVNFIIAEKNLQVKNLYGIAYKSISIGVMAALQLAARTKREIGFFYNRKEEKTHGEKGEFVGLDKRSGNSLIIIDDVLSSGMSIKSSLEKLARHNIYPLGIFVAIDRQERGVSGKAAKQEIEDQLGVKITPILSLDEVVRFLYKKRVFGEVWIDEECYHKIKDYREKYGAIS